MKVPRIAIVGGGMAGASAAYRFLKCGARVTVFERNSWLGGRARSTRTGGLNPFIQEHAGQFFLSHYEGSIPGFGFRGELVELGPYTSIFRDGRFRRINRNSAYSIYNEGLLSIRACERVNETYARMAEKTEGLSPDRLTAWYEFDHASGLWWSERKYGEEGTAYLMNAIFSSLFFHSLQYASAVPPAWMISNLARGDRWYVPRQGSQSVVEASLKDVADIRLNTPVTGIGVTEDRMAYVKTDGGEELFDFAVVTIPAPEAVTPEGFAIIRDPTEQQRKFLEDTRYWSTIVVNLGLGERIADSNLQGSYMAMIPESERMFLHGGAVAFSIESGKGKGAELGRRELLGVHLMSDQARRMMHDPDGEIVKTELADLRQLLPGVDRVLSDFSVTRWPCAIPHMRPGRVFELVRFWWGQEEQTSPVYIAGDGTSFPTFAGAAWSGKRTYEIITKRLRDLSFR